jgi:polysaccharide biosynthesis protein PslH
VRILFLCGDFPEPPNQGDRIRAHYILKTLSAAHEVVLLSAGDRTPPSDSPLLRACMATFHIPVPRLEMMKAAIRYPWLPTTVAARKQSAITQAVQEVTRAYQVDLAYAYQHRMVPHALAARVRVVADLTDSLWQYRVQRARSTTYPQRLFHHFEALKLRHFERHTVNRAELVLLSSPDEARLFRNTDSLSRVAVIPNGVDPDLYGPVCEHMSTEPVLLFVGHMGYPPNVDGVLSFYRDAFEHIVRAVPDVRLVVVGKEPAPAIQALKRDSRVEITGEVDDVRPYLSRSMVAICPLRYGSGTRIKILEAMAAGRPVVSTAAGCSGLAVVPNRDLLVVREPGDMVQPIIRMISDPEYRVAVGRAGLRLVRDQYDWRTIGSTLLEVLRAL